MKAEQLRDPSPTGNSNSSQNGNNGSNNADENENDDVTSIKPKNTLPSKKKMRY